MELITFGVAFVLSGIFIALPILFKDLFFHRRRLTRNRITGAYVPPLALSPAELSYVFNKYLKPKDVAATVIDLVQRGLLHVRKIEHRKYVFIGPQVSDSLKPHEKIIIKHVDPVHGTSVRQLLESHVSHPDERLSDTFVPKDVAMNNMVANYMVEQGYLRVSTLKQKTLYCARVFGVYVVALVWIPLVVSVLTSLSLSGAGDFSSLGDIAVLFVVATLLFIVPLVIATVLTVYFRSRWAGRVWAAGPKLARHWVQTVSYRQYTHLSENDRLEYRSERLEKASKKEILPYSVAFGFVSNWQNILH